MLELAYRQLRFDKGRSTATCLGIAAVFAVILVLQGFQQGLYTQLRGVSEQRGADLIAAQAGVSNMVGARSVIPQMTRAQVEAVPGVAVANPMTTMPVIYEKDGRKSPIFLTVTDTAGGPPNVIDGRAVENDGEIVIDRSLAQLYGLAPGDDLEVVGYHFKIVGIAKNTAAMFTPFAFTNFGSLIDLYFEAKLAADISAFPLLSYLLIQLQPEADPQTVIEAIEVAAPDIDVQKTEVFADNDEQLGRTMFGAILAILIGVAYAAGVVVVALFMFSTAESRKRDLGILKALGFENRALASAIVLETSLLTLLAIPLGVALALAIAAVVQAVMPTYLIQPVQPGPLAQSIIACVAFALLGALLPLRFVRRLEPAEVFHS